MPVRAIGRTNSGMFASRASAAAVHRTDGFAGLTVLRRRYHPRERTAAGLAGASGPMRTPSDCTTCVSYALVSIAIS